MSRSLDDLVPEVKAMAEAHLAACKANGIDLLIYCTLRTREEQSELWAQGRTKPGRIVTNAQPGKSWHNWGRAYDCVPLRHGKPVWGQKDDDYVLWQTVGKLGEECGLEWAGRWVTFREFPHFQHKGGLTIADLLNSNRRT